ncbi:FtsW/RodA/SpoVE family cell cycle protein [Caviibacter abscessus]|uniref:FtsW/RodA/SpoVE family cell cycle protein n=1 Tax=Caviibacter abscessus TaxID=1766719 RepID=UPI000839B122|nr:FtsW/RodA/SpoVE family cell cycle protein [Caviibacter abscessus]
MNNIIDNATESVNKNKELQQFIKTHISLIILCILLILLTIGIVSVWSISSPLSELKHTNIGRKYFGLVGISVFLVAIPSYYLIRFKKISEGTLISLYILGFLFLLSPLVLGHKINGARRWINVFFIQLQPSEFAKPILIYIFAIYFNELKDVINKYILFFNVKMKAHMGITIIWSALVFFYCLAILSGKALTSTLQVALLAYLMLCVSNVEKKYKTAILGLSSLLLIPAAFLVKYRLERITQFQSGGSQQTLEGLTAIKTGFLFGRGFGSGFQKYFYLSEAHTDYIFSAIAEELGLILSLIVLSLFIVLVALIFYAAINAMDSTEKYVIFGVGFVLTNQIIAHIGINLGLLPSTGITLPFISYGGSALMSNLICMSLLFKALDNMEWKVIK